MKKQSVYLVLFVLLVAVEVFIGAFVRDDFLRPYVGDMLVTALLCCLVRVLRPEGLYWLPAGVFAFTVAVECAQLIEIPALEGTILGIIMGSTFDWKDLCCYAIGCLLFAAGEGFLKNKMR